MANQMADMGGNKGQLSTFVEALCRHFCHHDDEEPPKLVHPPSLRLSFIWSFSLIIAHHRSSPRIASIFVCNFANTNLNKTPPLSSHPLNPLNL